MNSAPLRLMSVDDLMQDDGVDLEKATTLTELISSDFSGNQLGRGISFFDFDQTLTLDDVGVQVFLAQILNQRFWQFSSKDFNKILLPDRYETLLNKYARSIDPLLGGPCNFALDLVHDIEYLYKRIKNNFSDIRNSNGKIAADLRAAHSKKIVAEFVAKMVEFDAVMMSLDKHFSAEFGGEFFQRIRSFANGPLSDIRDYVDSVFDDRYEGYEFELNGIRQSSFLDGGRKRKVPRKVKRDDPRLSETKTIMVTPRLNTPGVLALKEAKNLELLRRIITTNHPIIVQQVIENMDELLDNLYDNKNLPRRDEAPIVSGTRLKRDRNTGVVLPEYKGPAMSGIQKAVRARVLCNELRATPIFYAGDSTNGDLEGQEMVMGEGGISLLAVRYPNISDDLAELVKETARRFKVAHERSIGTGYDPKKEYVMLPEELFSPIQLSS